MLETSKLFSTITLFAAGDGSTDFLSRLIGTTFASSFLGASSKINFSFLTSSF